MADNNNNRNNKNNKNSNRLRGILTLVAWAVVLTVAMNYISAYSNNAANKTTSHEIKYSQMVEMIEKNQVVVVRRDTREKIVVSLDEITTKLGEILKQVQDDMLARAKAHLEAHIDTAISMEEMIEKVQENRGFIKAMWCGEEACEEEIKAQTGGVTSRCIPMEEEHLSDVCVCCGKPAKHMVYWGKAY